MNKLALGLTTTALTAILALGAGQEVGAANTVSYDSTAVAGVSVSIDTFVASQEEKEAEVTEKKVETKKSPYANIAIAKVDNSVNIRKKADESSEVVGKLYKGAAGTVVKKGKVWTKIKSGSVTGYVKNTYLVYGSAAEKYANQVGTKIATVNTTTLKVRNKRSISKSEVVTLVPIEEKFEVLKEYDKWVRIQVDEDVKGYVAKEFVDIEIELDEAVSIEEEQRRQQQEQEEQQEANTNSSSSSSNSNSSSNSGNSNKPSTPAKKPSTNVSAPTNTSATRQEVVNYALQFVGNPYKYGGTSLTNGTDCSGFTMSVYAHFGISLNRTSRDQVKNGTNIPVSQVQPGDLVFYTKSNGVIGHVALYIGNGQVVHASTEKTGIKISNMYYRTPYKATSILD